MPFLGKLLDKTRKRKHKPPSAEEAINNLRDIEALLVKKQEYYEDKITSVGLFLDMSDVRLLLFVFICGYVLAPHKIVFMYSDSWAL